MARASTLKVGDTFLTKCCGICTVIEYVSYVEGYVEDIVNLEADIHKTLKPHHYVPSIPFGGHVTECFNGSGLNIALSMINEFKKENP